MPGRGQGHRWGQKGWSRRAVRFLEPTLLLLLHRGPAHGYTFLEALKDFGLADSDPSVLYRALRDMEEKGWVTSCWDEVDSQGPPRRVYLSWPKNVIRAGISLSWPKTFIRSKISSRIQNSPSG